MNARQKAAMKQVSQEAAWRAEFEDIRRIAAKRGWTILASPFYYRGRYTRFRVRCENGHEPLRSASYVKAGIRCPDCRRERMRAQSMEAYETRGL